MNPEIERLQREVAEAKKKLTDARRALPPEPVRDYSFAMSGTGVPVKLSQLFGRHDELILVHNMGRSCVYCTLWADGFKGLYPHLANRCAFALSTPDEPAVSAAFASSRGWPFPVVSIAGTTFAADMGYSDPKHPVMPGVSMFKREKDGSIVRTGHAPFGPGDDFCAVWPMLDLLPKTKWEPKYHYAGGDKV